MESRESVEKDLATIEQCMRFWSLRRASVVVAIPLACLWAFYAILDAWWFEGMLPVQLHTVGLTTVSRDQTRLEIAITPGRYKSCGGGTFTLSRRALRAIEAEGLGFFDRAQQSRRDTNRGFRLRYAPWQETPLPPRWTDLGPWLGLNCMGPPWTRGRIFQAAREPGSYFTTTTNAELLVIPRLGLAVFTFYAF